MRNETGTYCRVYVIVILLFFYALRSGAATSIVTTLPQKSKQIKPAITVPAKALPLKQTKIQIVPAQHVVSVLVPDLKGLTLPKVFAVLKKKKLALTVKIAGERYHPAITVRHIISQVPEPGTLVASKTCIRVIISKGGAPMPDLKGKAVASSIKFLRNKTRNGIDYRPYALIIHQTKVFSDLSPGLILKHLPKSGVSLKKGMSVELFVSKGHAPRPTHLFLKTPNRVQTISSVKQRHVCRFKVFDVKNPRVVRGNSVVIRLPDKAGYWKSAVFYINRHRISPQPLIRKGLIYISTKNLQPGRYKITARLPHLKEFAGEILVQPEQVVIKAAHLTRKNRRVLPVATPKIYLAEKNTLAAVKSPTAEKGKTPVSRKYAVTKQPKARNTVKQRVPDKTVSSVSRQKPRPRGKTYIFSIPEGKLKVFKRSLEKNGVKIKIARKRFLKSLGFLLLSLQTTQPEKVKRIAVHLAKQKTIRAFQTSHIYHTHGLQGDPYASRQYGCLPLKKLSEIHIGCMGKGIHIALLDTGADIYHEDLNPRKIETVDFTKEGLGRFLTDIHGTALCGILAALPDNGKGLVGLVPSSTLHIIKVCKSISPSSIQATTDTFTLAEGLDYAIQKRVHIINVSIGGPRDSIIEKLIRRARSGGIFIVAAAGNSGPRGPPTYPAAYPGVIGVTAVDQNLNLYAHATQGSFVDLAAPGVDVFSLRPGSRYNFYTGTSFAAAYVTGIIALKLSCSHVDSGISPGIIPDFMKAAAIRPPHWNSGKLGEGILIFSKIPKKLFF